MKSYDAGPTDTPILEETIGANFTRTAATYPDVEALVDVAGGRRWTYAELDAEIDTIAAKNGFCYNYFGGAQQVTSGSYTIVWNGSGIASLSVA